MRSVGQRLATKPTGKGVGEETILVDVLEGGGDGGLCRVAVHAERLHVPQDAAPSVALDGDVVPRLCPGRPPVVEHAVGRPASTARR